VNHDTIAKLIDDQMEAYYNGDYMDSSDAKGQLLEFAKLVAAAEREACAQVVEDWHFFAEDPREVAKEIRALSD